MGDFVIFTPVLHNIYLADSFRLNIILDRSLKDLVSVYPWFDNVIYVNFSSHCVKKFAQAIYVFVYFLFHQKVDICVMPLWSISKVRYLITSAVRARMRIGFVSDLSSRKIFTHPIKIQIDERDIDQNLKILKLLDLDCRTTKTVIFNTEYSNDRADLFLKHSNVNIQKELIAIAPINKGMKGSPSKNWPLDRYLQLTQHILQFEEAHIVFLGTSAEILLVKEKLKDVDGQRIIFLPPDFTLLEVAAVLEKCSILICNDGGLMHIAVALGISVLSIWGITSPHIWGYLNQDNFHAIWKDNCKCSMKYRRLSFTCDSQECMDSITVPEVFSEFQGIINAKKGAEM